MKKPDQIQGAVWSQYYLVLWHGESGSMARVMRHPLKPGGRSKAISGIISLDSAQDTLARHRVNEARERGGR